MSPQSANLVNGGKDLTILVHVEMSIPLLKMDLSPHGNKRSWFKGPVLRGGILYLGFLPKRVSMDEDVCVL